MSRAAVRSAGLLFAIATTLFSHSVAALTPPWFEGAGNFFIGTDYACLSDPPILETRVAGYSGYTYMPPQQLQSIPLAQFPAPGEVFYVKLVLSHPGNPCAGSAVGVEMLLPAGVTPANSTANPAFCFALVPANAQHNYPILYNLANDSGYGCPQTYPQGLQGLAIVAPNGGIGGGAWGMAQGVWLEFLIPLRSSVPQNGVNSITFRVNPDLGVYGNVNVPLYVNADTIFRAAQEPTVLTLDLCGIYAGTQGC